MSSPTNLTTGIDTSPDRTVEIDARLHPSFEVATRQVLTFIQQRLGVGIAFVGRIDSDAWLIIDTHGDSSFGLAPGDVKDFSTTFCARMLDGRRPRLAPDATAVPAFADMAVIATMGIGAYIGVPIRLSSGELYGTLCALDHGPRVDLTQDDLTFVEAMARLMAFEVERERTRLQDGREHDRLREQGERDPLTGLANRRAWDAAIAAERGRTALRETSVALMFDMDGSWAINDRHGHAAGDAHLRAFGDGLRAAARASDVVARLGGDEFGVLLLGGTAAAGQAFLERLRSVVERSSPTVEFSVGRSLAVDGDDLDRAVVRAHTALREAKASRPSDLFGRVRRAR